MAELGHANPHSEVPSATGEGLSNDNAVALAASRVVKVTAGKLFHITFTNTNAAIRFLQIFDANALPADATVPLISISVPIGGTQVLDWGTLGRAFVNGIVVCNSTTQATKTIGAADSLIDTQFV
jgi:hypothetical protein